jgi:hypothetical protein
MPTDSLTGYSGVTTFMPDPTMVGRYQRMVVLQQLPVKYARPAGSLQVGRKEPISIVSAETAPKPKSGLVRKTPAPAPAPVPAPAPAITAEIAPKPKSGLVRKTPAPAITAETASKPKSGLVRKASAFAPASAPAPASTSKDIEVIDVHEFSKLRKELQASSKFYNTTTGGKSREGEGSNKYSNEDIRKAYNDFFIPGSPPTFKDPNIKTRSSLLEHYIHTLMIVKYRKNYGNIGYYERNIYPYLK